MKHSVNSARETKIYVIDNGKVTSTNLYDHVMESAEEVSSPRGREYALHITHREDEDKYHLNIWDHFGKSKLIEMFDTYEEAEDELFNKTFVFDFMEDDQRDTRYWFQKYKAIEQLMEDKKY